MLCATTACDPQIRLGEQVEDGKAQDADSSKAIDLIGLLCRACMSQNEVLN